MAKVDYYALMEHKRNKMLNEFYDEIAKQKSQEEVKKIFNGLLTKSEQVMLSRRLQIAKLLLGGLTYREIEKELKVGKTTVTTVDRWLEDGLKDYRPVVRDLRDNNMTAREEDFPFSFASLRRNYPAHFWLINIFLNDKK